MGEGGERGLPGRGKGRQDRKARGRKGANFELFELAVKKRELATPS
jgi:hypothetical protein